MILQTMPILSAIGEFVDWTQRDAARVPMAPLRNEEVLIVLDPIVNMLNSVY
jgi:hypothetical protein